MIKHRLLASTTTSPGTGELLLASTSTARQALLTAAGIAFRAVPPGVEETAPQGLSPKQIAKVYALLKANAVARRFPSALVVGSDQTVDLAGIVLRKPRSRADARRQLESLSGNKHCIHTAVALINRDRSLRKAAVESVKLTMRSLSRREIEAYLDTDEWRGCAGAYRVEGQGIKLFRAIRGDFHAVIGLPLIRLLNMLREIG